MENVDYERLAQSLATNRTFMKKIKNSILYQFDGEIAALFENAIVDKDDVRATIIEELPKALRMLFAEEE